MTGELRSIPPGPGRPASPARPWARAPSALPRRRPAPERPGEPWERIEPSARGEPPAPARRRSRARRPVPDHGRGPWTRSGRPDRARRDDRSHPPLHRRRLLVDAGLEALSPHRDAVPVDRHGPVGPGSLLLGRPGEAARFEPQPIAGLEDHIASQLDVLAVAQHIALVGADRPHRDWAPPPAPPPSSSSSGPGPRRSPRIRRRAASASRRGPPPGDAPL